MKVELEETVIIRTKDGEFRGKVMQLETSKRPNSTLYRVMVHVYENKAEQPLKAPMKALAGLVPKPPEK